MIKAGLVVKVKDPNMKSLVRVFLIKNGQKAYDLVIKRKTIHEVINVLSTKQQRQLSVHLKKCVIKLLKNWEIYNNIHFLITF